MDALVEKTKAERLIAGILLQLEETTGGVVVGIHLREIDVTTIADTALRVERVLAVDLAMPGQAWRRG